MTIRPELTAIVGELDFDPDALHAKYLFERDKRLRDDGIGQYVEVKAEFSHYVDDPYVEPGFTRAPVSDEVEFAIIGGGFGGLLMGARLKEAGVEDIRVVEAAGDFGGTWYWNRYPGAQCDVESYCLPAAARGARLHAVRQKYSFVSPRSSSTHNAIGQPLSASTTRQLSSRPASRGNCAGMRGECPLGGSSRPTAATMLEGPLRGDGASGTAQPAQAAGHPGIETFKGHTFTPAAGTIATPAGTRPAAT